MTKIECNDCGELVEFTGASVVLPFTCSSCQSEAAIFQEKIAPAPCQEETLPIVEIHNNCDCDTASVEATTELIANLEAQIKTLTEAGEALSDMVVADNAVIDDLKSQLDTVTTELNEQGETISRLVGKNIDLFIDLNDLKVSYAKFRSWTKVLIDDLARDLKQESAAKDYYIESYEKAGEEIHRLRKRNCFLITRGFWERVRNVLS